MRITGLLLALILIISGCVTGERVRDVEPGMPVSEVLSIMGNPDGFREKDGYTIYTYSNRLISGWSNDRTDYTFIFRGGRLQEYGPGEVREKVVNGVSTIFIHQF